MPAKVAGNEGAPNYPVSEAGFALAVFRALRDFNRPENLRFNLLLASRLVRTALNKSPGALPTEVLRELIRAHCASIGRNPKYLRYQQVLQLTYLAPLRRQRAVADALHLSWGSYRRYLREARRMLTASLWEAECNSSDASPPAAPPAARAPVRRRSRLWLPMTIAAAAAIVLAGGMLLVHIQRKTQIASPIRMSLAVLPMLDLARKAADSNIGTAISSSILAQLGQVRGLRVIIEPPAFSSQNRNQDAHSLGRLLNVRDLLEGDFQNADGQLRINMELINTADDSVSWSDQVTAPPADLLQLEDSLGNALVLHLSEASVRPPTEDTVQDRAQARDQYLIGQAYLVRPNVADLAESLQYFRESVRIDPGYSPSWAALASAYALLPGYDDSRSPDADYVDAWSAINKALAITPLLPSAHAVLGLLQMQQWKWRRAQQELRLAMQLDLYSATAHLWYARYMWFTGQPHRALSEMRFAHALDSQSPIVNADLGRALLYAGELRQAQAQLLETIARRPDYAPAYFRLIEDEVALHQFRRALASAKAAGRLACKTDPMLLMEMGVAQSRLGHHDKTSRYLATLRRQARSQYVSGVAMARLYWELNDRQHAFAELQRAAREHDPNLLVVSGPDWAAVRSDPRFAQIRALMRLPAIAASH